MRFLIDLYFLNEISSRLSFFQPCFPLPIFHITTSKPPPLHACPSSPQLSLFIWWQDCDCKSISTERSIEQLDFQPDANKLKEHPPLEKLRILRSSYILYLLLTFSQPEKQSSYFTTNNVMCEPSQKLCQK